MRTCTLLLSLALLAGCATPGPAKELNSGASLPPLTPPAPGPSDADIEANPQGYFGAFLLLLRH